MQMRIHIHMQIKIKNKTNFNLWFLGRPLFPSQKKCFFCLSSRAELYTHTEGVEAHCQLSSHMKSHLTKLESKYYNFI